MKISLIYLFIVNNRCGNCFFFNLLLKLIKMNENNNINKAILHLSKHISCFQISVIYQSTKFLKYSVY